MASRVGGVLRLDQGKERAGEWCMPGCGMRAVFADWRALGLLNGWRAALIAEGTWAPHA